MKSWISSIRTWWQRFMAPVCHLCGGKIVNRVDDFYCSSACSKRHRNIRNAAGGW